MNFDRSASQFAGTITDRAARQFAGTITDTPTKKVTWGPRPTDPRLSPRQKQILDFVKDRIEENGFPPTIREIGEHVGLQSSSTVHLHLKTIERKGHLDRDKGSPRGLRLVQRVDMREVRSLLERWMAASCYADGPRDDTRALLETMRGGK